MIKRSSYIQLLFLSLLGIWVWHFFPIPVGLSISGWHLLIIFLLTIIGIIFEPFPISVVALLSALICILTNTITFQEVFSGFSSSVMWIVVFAFFIARGLIKTGLGKRIAYTFIEKIGGTTLGLSYGIILTEFLLSLVVPSVSARAGGIMYPVTQSIIKEYEKNNNPSLVRRTSMFLLQVCFQGATVTCAMFITAMSGNALIVSIGSKLGAEINWSNWAIGAIVPGILSLTLLPLLLYVICHPSIKVSKDAPTIAKQALLDMGPLRRNEIIMIFTFLVLVLFWIFGKSIGIDSTTTAFIGVVALLLSGVLTWDDLLSERSAWDIMIWFSILLTMSSYLSSLGVMSWIGQILENLMSTLQYSKQLIFCGVIFIYFFVHYFFASVTAHITVFYSIFVGLLVNLCHIDLLLACLIIAYISSLSGGLTHYGNSAAPIFFGARYFNIIQWWRIGFIVSTFNLVLWTISGYFWWSFLGWI